MATKVNDGTITSPRQTQCADGNFQRDRSVTHGDAMAHAEKLGNLPLELLNVRAIVRQPVAVQHVIDSREETVAVTDVRAPDVQLIRERWRPSEYRQFAQFRFGTRLQHLCIPLVLYTIRH